MNAIIEINTALSGSGKSRRIKRTVLLNGEEVYCDSRCGTINLSENDPINSFMYFLCGKNHPIDAEERFEKILLAFKEGGSPSLTGWNFTQQQVDRIAEALEGHPQKEYHLKYVLSRLRR